MSKARDLANAGTALGAVTATELGYVDGVTSAIQTQLNAKQAVVSGVDNTEIGYLDGVTSSIQTQLNARVPNSTITTKGDLIVGTGDGTYVRQGVGTNGQVLTANSAQADGVEWVTPAGGAGNMVQVATGSLTSGTTLNVTGLSSYTDLIFIVYGLTFSTQNESARFTINSNTGANYQQFITSQQALSGTTAGYRQINATEWIPTFITNIARTNSSNFFYFKLTNCKNPGFTDINAVSTWRDNNYTYTESSQGVFTNSAAVSSLQFFLTANPTQPTFTAGTYIVYGA